MEIIENRIEKSKQQLKEIKEEKRNKEDYVNSLQSSISLYEDKIDILEQQKQEIVSEIKKVNYNIYQNEENIKNKEYQISKNQAEFDHMYKDYCERIRAVYISGHFSILDMLLDSKDMSSLLVRSEMVKQVSNHDKKELNTLKDRMKQIKSDKLELEKNKEELANNKIILENKQKELEHSINYIYNSKKDLTNKTNECNKIIKELSKTSNNILESIETDREAEKKLQEEIKNAAQTKPPQKPNNPNKDHPSNKPNHTESLGYPTKYRNISAGYPNYPSGRYHGGIDFPCPTGTPVYASASGVVALAKNLNYSYGHYILINHDKGLSTLYAHNSSLLVSVGEEVKKGQLIAYSGSTGNSTGPHCHFEVRLNGNRVNPLNYLT